MRSPTALLVGAERDGGGEFQWGRREHFSDGFQSDGVKVQFAFRYNFSWTLGG
jgi:hypothetical protein